jgi:formamidase
MVVGAPTLHCRSRHFQWDNSLPAALELEPGAVIELEVLEASAGQVTRSSSASAIRTLDFGRVNPVTGPLFVKGAEPGDSLCVEFLGFEPSGWGWTAIIPGFGLLAADFPEPFLHLSQYNQQHIEFLPGVALPTRPFVGTIGLALKEPGAHSVIPPRHVGGNLDCRDMIAGTIAQFPVEVPGALLSLGDTHAAQGDGEVCGTAIESAMLVRVRLNVQKRATIRAPRLRVPAQPAARGPSFVTLGIGPDLMQASRDAVREMIDHLMTEYRLSPELSYCLCSVAVQLEISEIVDAPNWVVAARLPTDIFR